MTRTIIWWFCFMGTLTVTNSQTSFTCVLPSQTADAPVIPQVTVESKSYQATVEVTVVQDNSSYVWEEYLDYEGNRGKVITHLNGVTTSIIYSYVTDEVFTIVDDECTVTKLSDNPNEVLFGPGLQTGPGRRHIGGSSEALRFAADVTDVYNGTAVVRGMPADVWVACIDWPGAAGKVKATFYFSQTNWLLSAPRKQLPLRVEVEGYASGTQGESFHQIYDYINYLPYVEADPSIFLTPPSVVCEGRVNTRTIPTLPNYFSLRAEKVDTLSGIVQHIMLWYDFDAKLIREDVRNENPKGSGKFTDSLSRVNDFNEGVLFTVDHEKGCSIKPEPVDGIGVKPQQKIFDGASYFVAGMKGPESLFSLNFNYTYVGQRQTRGVVCDVFIATATNLTVDGTSANVTFEYYFLARGWHDVPLDSTEAESPTHPVQMVITAPDLYKKDVINFHDFSDVRPRPGVFDISSCFDNSQKFSVRLTFPGSIDTSDQMKNKWSDRVHMMLAETMKVNPLRVAGVQTSMDFQNVFINAQVLGTADAALFEMLPNQTREKAGDVAYSGILEQSECATMCATHTDFPCKSFLYCPDHNFACRLSKQNMVTGADVSGGDLCFAFTRAVEGPVTVKTSLADAYSNLVTAVQTRQLQILLQDEDGFEPLEPLTAINVELKAGSLLKDKPMPSLGQTFFVRIETVTPDIQQTTETFMWYDQELQLIRIDARDLKSMLQTTYITDFRTGVAYRINQVTQQCTISSIGKNGPFVAQNSTTASSLGTLTMRGPLNLFYIDGSYKYIGQSTERGILCDVFEARRDDIQLPSANTNVTKQLSVAKYFFQVDNWKYVGPEGMDTTTSQPVRFDLEDRTTNQFLRYNMYDFNDERHAFSYYDTSLCFQPEQRKSFLIIFKDQPYHPTLDETSTSFLNSALLQMGKLTFTSPARFQEVSVMHDDDSVYLLATALGMPPALTLFYNSTQVTRNKTATQQLAMFADDCAAACEQINSFLCRGFDFCGADSDSPSCLLYADVSAIPEPVNLNGPGASSIPSTDICTRYIRSENVTLPDVTAEQIFQTITNKVYDGAFKISVNPPGGKAMTYTATDIRDDILRPTDPESASGSLLKKFTKIPKSKIADSAVAVKHFGVSITDCALMCLQENTFLCEAFDFQSKVGTCRLTDVFPKMSDVNTTLVSDDYTTLYTKLYTSQYRKLDAEVFTTKADKLVNNINSDEMCAKACTETTDFRCEAFEICASSSTCKLRKTHAFSAIVPTSAPGGRDTQPALGCVHYSRDHLYDYIRRDHKVVVGHDEAEADVTDVSRCAYLCNSGDILPSCASFEVTELQQGNIRCVFSTVDPTNTTSSQVVIQDSLPWALYTRANKELPLVNPTVHHGPVTAKPETTTQAAGTTKCTDTSNSSSLQAPSQGSDDTKIRLGIGFGTLVVGLLLGVVGTHFGTKFYRRRSGNTEDTHVLSPWRS